MISALIFSILFLSGIFFFIWNVRKIRSNILLGRDVSRSDHKSKRIKTMLLVAFGQQKMFKKPIPAILHLMLYTAFIITQIELIEIVVDGISGEHRYFRPSLGSFYTFMISFIEVLSVLAFAATFIFLSRRNLIKVPRLNMKEMTGWPKLDGNIILIAEIILICFIIMMNGADEALLQLNDGNNSSYSFAISQYLGPLLFGEFNTETLQIIERIGWWGHLIMVLSFLNYLPFSKHFHILLAFPNTYYSKLDSKGKFSNNAAVTNEVKLMLDPSADPYATASNNNQEIQRFGAKDVTDLTWKNLMDSYTCTECGRCSAVCPANQTGKLLSPRKIMMDTRDRLDEVGNNKRSNGKDFEDGKSLLGDYITEEELWACTSCNACVEECPVNIDPLSIIMEMRRYLVMEESKAPSELTNMFTNIENNGAPWQFSQADRINWKNEN